MRGIPMAEKYRRIKWWYYA